MKRLLIGFLFLVLGSAALAQFTTNVPNGRIYGNSTVTGNFVAADGNLYIDLSGAALFTVGSVTLNGAASTFTGNLILTGNETVDGNLTVVHGILGQILSVTSNLTWTGAGNNLDLAQSGIAAGTYGDATHVGMVTFNDRGIATLASATAITFPAVTGNSVPYANVTGGGALGNNSVGGNLSMVNANPGNLTVSGNATTGNLTVTGNSSVNSLLVSGNETVLGNLTVTNGISGPLLSIAGNITRRAGNADVNLDAADLINLPNWQTPGNLTGSGASANTTIFGNITALNISGNYLSITGNLARNASGLLDAIIPGNPATTWSALTGGGAAGNNTTAGNITFINMNAGNGTVTGNFTTGNLTATGNATLAGLSVTGNIGDAGNLTVPDNSFQLSFLSPTGAASTNVIAWNGTAWAPAAAGVGGWSGIANLTLTDYANVTPSGPSGWNFLQNLYFGNSTWFAGTNTFNGTIQMNSNITLQSSSNITPKKTSTLNNGEPVWFGNSTWFAGTNTFNGTIQLNSNVTLQLSSNIGNTTDNHFLNVQDQAYFGNATWFIGNTTATGNESLGTISNWTVATGDALQAVSNGTYIAATVFGNIAATTSGNWTTTNGSVFNMQIPFWIGNTASIGGNILIPGSTNITITGSGQINENAPLTIGNVVTWSGNQVLAKSSNITTTNSSVLNINTPLILGNVTTFTTLSGNETLTSSSNITTNITGPLNIVTSLWVGNGTLTSLGNSSIGSYAQSSETNGYQISTLFLSAGAQSLGTSKVLQAPVITLYNNYSGSAAVDEINFDDGYASTPNVVLNLGGINSNGNTTAFIGPTSNEAHEGGLTIFGTGLTNGQDGYNGVKIWGFVAMNGTVLNNESPVNINGSKATIITNGSAFGNIALALSSTDVLLTISNNTTSIIDNIYGDGSISTSGNGGFTSITTTGNINNAGVFYGSALTSYTSFASGTPWVLTTTTQEMKFGTSNTSITLTNSGNYVVMGGATIQENGATFASGANVTLQIYRKNNTSGNISNATVIVEAPVMVSALNQTLGVVSFPPTLYITSNTNDIITMNGSISASPGAGNVTVKSANLLLIPAL